jgi:glycosyltransferase 2 family protein
VAMGFMANNVLPFRAGELLRTYAASRLTGSRLTATFSSIAVERVFDGLAVVALLAGALFTVELPASAATESVTRAATTAGILCLLALLAACLVVFLPLWAERVIRRIVPSTALAERLVALIEGLRHGLAVLGSPSRLAAVCLWSIGIWLVNAASFYAAFLAFDLPVGFSGALLLQGLLVFGIAVPSTPGYVGVFEAVIQAVLLLYGVSDSRGAAYALVYHMTTFVPITLLGLYSLLHTRIGLGEARKVRIA